MHNAKKSKNREILRGTITCLILFIGTSCANPDSALLTESNSSSNISTISSCSSQIIDFGNKGNAATTQRGQWSDVKATPDGEGVALAYYDGSTTSGPLMIRFAYQSGTSFLIENVAGDRNNSTGSARWVRLVFLNSGIPMIFWATNSTVVKMAMRSAPLTTQNATWTAAVIDEVSGGNSRALEVAVSPRDQVALIYLTEATTAGRARFVFCPANCSSPYSFISMTSNSDAIEAANIAANQTETGVAWCNAGSNTYYPAVTWSASGNVRYSVCQGDLLTCTAASGWTTMTALAAANIASKLYIDSSTEGGTPKILTKNAGNLQAIQINQACNTTPTSASTNGNTFGASASTGDAFFSFMFDSTGKAHIVANESTTSLSYYNSVGTDFLTTAFNGAGTVDTVTLAAASAGGGGAALSEDRGVIYTSYPDVSEPYNLQLGIIGDYTLDSDSSSMVYSIQNPDQTGFMQLERGQKRNISVAQTSTGVPAAAYVDYSSGSSSGSILKYAIKSGTGLSDSWSSVRIPGTADPENPSLAFDASDKPWISYFDAANFRFYLITNSATDGSSPWSRYQFPLSSMSSSPALPANNDTALAMQYVSDTQYSPVMFVINGSAGGNNGVLVSRFNASTGLWSSVVTVDALGASFASNLSVDYKTSSSQIAVSYYDLTNEVIRYTYTTNPISAWTTAATVTSFGGDGLNIKINPSTGRPEIAYFDYLDNKVYLARCSGTLSSCQTSGGWTPNIIETLAGTSTLTTGTTGNLQILQASLTHDSNGDATILYMTGVGGIGSMKRATESSGSFSESIFHAGVNSTLTLASPVNFGLAGFNVSSVVSPDGVLNAVYVGPGNWLYAKSCPQ